jgi:preprotein translocase subunit Sec63
MLTSTFDNIENVLAFGHILTIVAIIFILNSTLRARRISSSDLTKAKEIDIESSENKEDEKGDDEQTEESEEDESWQGDVEVDWENPKDIGKGAEWSESDQDSEE